MAIYYDNPQESSSFRSDICVPFSGRAPTSMMVNIKTLVSQQVASEHIKTPLRELPGGYNNLFHWIRQSGYEIMSPPREIYWQVDDSPKVELQVAVKKAEKKP
jgi:effector-binding domain-containing protein